MYKQLNAPFGLFGMSMLAASTRAIKSGSATNDQTYTKLEGKIETLTARRDVLASQMKTMLDAAAFNGQAIDERQARTLINQAEVLLDRARELSYSNN